jgi:hypothetical protein
MSYIQIGAKGSDHRRHAVPQRGGASEAFGTSTIGDHQLFSSSQPIITHCGVVVKKNFVNIRKILTASAVPVNILACC